ncbi:glycoside hydrolase family 12 protein [Emericellopsis atlantica]|uniref:Glycoside hydrolase family 12 protein n=1 Tax=Emericellopsis atlantica TaxID=2614577 RepID=A0A9P8CMH2_9HYPO|nr:glycoside hydrolase family 12 protein [Emericellopsis atlantica]KAG9250681.1 glycoside hydrolase family 12 protein [Emericellopsis atlantica]
MLIMSFVATVKLFALLAIAHLGAHSRELCDRFSYHLDYGYGINNNVWGSGSGDQCTYIDSIAYTGIAWHVDWTWQGDQNTVKSYPYSGRDFAEKISVSAIRRMPISVDWDYHGNDIRANVAFDLFTASDAEHSHTGGHYEVMVWLATLGDVEPIGQLAGDFTVGGLGWQLYDGFNGDMHVYTFVAPQPIYTWQADLKLFFDHLSRHGFPSATQSLLTLQVGTEPFSGGPATFSVRHFWSEIE